MDAYWRPLTFAGTEIQPNYLIALGLHQKMTRSSHGIVANKQPRGVIKRGEIGKCATCPMPGNGCFQDSGSKGAVKWTK